MSTATHAVTAPHWPELMRREMAAAYLDMGPSTFDRLTAAGKIKGKRLTGRLIRYRKADLDRFIEKLPYGRGDLPTVE